jgi:hypothetical protein
MGLLTFSPSGKCQALSNCSIHKNDSNMWGMGKEGKLK